MEVFAEQIQWNSLLIYHINFHESCTYIIKKKETFHKYKSYKKKNSFEAYK